MMPAIVAGVGRIADAAEGPASTAQGFTDTGGARVGGGNSVGGSPPATAESLPVYVVPYGVAPGLDRASEYDRFIEERQLREWSETAIDPQTIYFPPAPPVLGAPLPSLGLFSDDVARALSPHVNEPFYAPLSTRLAEEDLGRRVRARLESYHEQKLSALEELRARLRELRGAGAAERRASLEELAQAQAGALDALERLADDLRREFYRSRFLSGGGDWSQFRVWRLDASATAPVTSEASFDERRREFRVLRAAVYYQEGLSPAQRRLLRELVMEQAVALHQPGAGLALESGDSSRVIFFSPDTARVALPANLPPGLAAEIDDYVARKAALRAQLRERIVMLDADRNATRRVRSLQELGAEQAVRLADLESQADRIREQLAPLLPASTPATLPGALEGRVAAYLQAKSELQRVAQDRLAAALGEFDARDRDDNTRRRADRRAALVRTTVETFHADHADQIAGLNAEAEAIRSELVRHVSARPSEAEHKSIDMLLREFADSFKRQQFDALYTEYRTAVFEPGLSAAQRRLLFDGVLADLKLPGAIRDQQVPADEELSPP